jgi:hypothetical protein
MKGSEEGNESGESNKCYCSIKEYIKKHGGYKSVAGMQDSYDRNFMIAIL